MKILIVDDSETVRLMLKKNLNDLGYSDITEAVDGQMAIQILREANTDGVPYKVMFLDWNMPRVTGYEVLEEIKSTEELYDLKIVMVTSVSEESQIVQAIAAGANDYVVKPFSLDTLERKLQKIKKSIR